MFCSKCGKEIMDEAVICPNCGCATNNYNAPQQPINTATNTYSDDYLTIKQFSEQARILRNLGIFAAVLMFGIGIIFSIVIESLQTFTGRFVQLDDMLMNTLGTFIGYELWFLLSSVKLKENIYVK